MSGFDPLPVFGLKTESSNEEKRKTAFAFIHEMGYMTIATKTCREGLPTARGLELHYLDDTGDFFVGMAKGKPVYWELIEYPYLTGSITRMTDKDLAMSVRLTAHVVPVDPEEERGIYKKYWELNPGTKALYKKDLDMFRIFRLDWGDGEIFHLPDADEVSRVRFSFGKGRVRPWAYRITEECIGCGICAEACMRGVIFRTEKGRCEIDYQGCLECGRCYEHCPNKAIQRTFTERKA